MLQAPRFPFYILICLLVLLSGCEKRYWFRIKLNNAKKMQSIHVNVMNLSPGFLPKEFEDEIRKSCLKELKKQGYVLSVKDSPVYEFVLKLSVDSFNAGIRNFTREHAEYTADPSKYRSSSSAIYAFRKPVKAIMLNCRLQMYRSKATVWENHDDLYFFNEYMKDLGRCDGMVRYLIRSGEAK